MDITLFKDKGVSLNHRELDDNFLAIMDALQEIKANQYVVIGPTMTKGSSRYSIDNTIKMIGMRPQGGKGINYTYAKDTGKLYRKAAKHGACEVDEYGNALEYYNTGSSGDTTITPDGKYLINTSPPYLISVTNIATGEVNGYNISTWWEDAYMNYAGTVLIEDNILYVPCRISSEYCILRIAINSDTGDLSSIDRVLTEQRDNSAYFNASGDGKIAMSKAGDNNWIFDVESGTTTTVVTPSVSDAGIELAHLPIGFDNNGRTHFIRMDWDSGSVADIHNIYVQNNEGGVDPVAVSDSVRNELAIFGESYSENQSKMTSQLLDMPSCKLYGCHVVGYDISPFVLYNPETMEFVTLVDHTEAVFINKGE